MALYEHEIRRNISIDKDCPNNNIGITNYTMSYISMYDFSSLHISINSAYQCYCKIYVSKLTIIITSHNYK